MSQKLGRMVTCDRCGETVFEPMDMSNFEKHCNMDMFFFKNTKGWRVPTFYRSSFSEGCKSLCPKCYEKLDDVMSKFWSNEQALKEEFQRVDRIGNVESKV